MIVLRRCLRCNGQWETDESKDKNHICPKCRSKIGRARQKSIQKSVKKKTRKGRSL